MKRREFITLLGGAAVAWPFAVHAQQPTKRYRIGMLETISPALNTAHLDAFRKGLRELGYVEGKNYAIEYRSADGRAERFPELAAALKQQREIEDRIGAVCRPCRSQVEGSTCRPWRHGPLRLACRFQDPHCRRNQEVGQGNPGGEH
jgi:hypothetical protein